MDSPGARTAFLHYFRSTSNTAKGITDLDYIKKNSKISKSFDVKSFAVIRKIKDIKDV